MVLEQGGKSLHRDFIIASNAERSFDRLATVYWMRVKPEKTLALWCAFSPLRPEYSSPNALDNREVSAFKVKKRCHLFLRQCL
jgi:hypothetical protein